jgi:hypothetical protein
MKSVLKIGCKVKLKTFHGLKEPVKNESDNFWLLVDSLGEIVSETQKIHPAFPEKGARMLVKFDQNLEDLSLPCHNSIPNSLWIFVSDLELVL